MLPDLPDFETLRKMAEKDPQALEKLRTDHVNALIDSAPLQQQRRLRGLQFQIDAQRKIHHNPLSACVKISQMMHESFAQLRYALNDATGQEPRRPQQEAVAGNAAQIIELPR